MIRFLIIYLLMSTSLIAQAYKDGRDSIYITLNENLKKDLGKKNFYNNISNEEIISWNEFKDSLSIVTFENKIELNSKILKNKEAYNIFDLINMGVFDYLKIIENKVAFLVFIDESKRVSVFKIKSLVYLERPQY